MNIIGLLLGISLIGFFTYSEFPNPENEKLQSRLLDQHNDYPISKTLVYTTLDKYMCNNNKILPRGYDLPFVPNDYIFLPIVAASALLFLIAVTRKPKGIFAKLLKFAFSSLFLVVALIALVFFLNHTKLPVVCETIKPVVLIGFEMFTDPMRFKEVLLVKGGVISQIQPFIQPYMNQFVPHCMLIVETLVRSIVETMKNTPALVMVLGAFLLRKKGDILTKVFVIPFVLFVVILKADIALIAQGIPHGEVALVSSVFIILAVMIFNSFSKIGHYVMLPFMLIQMTSVMVMLYRVFDIEIFILFMVVFIVSLLYCYLWNKGSDIVAAIIIYYGYVCAFDMRSGMMLTAIFLLTGLFA